MKWRRKHGRVCPYCNRAMQKRHPTLRPTEDHKVPKSRGGTDEFDNIEIICLACNQEKASLLPDEFIAWREGCASRLDKGFRWRVNHFMFEKFKKEMESGERIQAGGHSLPEVR